MAIQASVIIDRAEKTLYDETNVRWSATELLDYLNAAISFVLNYKPDAYVITDDVSLTTNSSYQTIPAGGIQLLDIIRVTGGGAIRQIERNHLDHSNPNWHLTSGAPEHFMTDPRNVKVFWVYPVPSTSTQVEMVYSAQPTRLTSASDNIPFDDLFENALHFSTVGMAYAKNTTRGDLNKANAYFTLAANAIGIKLENQKAFTPLPPDEAQASERGSER